MIKLWVTAQLSVVVWNVIIVWNVLGEHDLEEDRIWTYLVLAGEYLNRLCVLLKYESASQVNICQSS